MSRLQNPEDIDLMKTNELAKQELLIPTHNFITASSGLKSSSLSNCLSISLISVLNYSDILSLLTSHTNEIAQKFTQEWTLSLSSDLKQMTEILQAEFPTQWLKGFHQVFGTYAETHLPTYEIPNYKPRCPLFHKHHGHIFFQSLSIHL